MLYGILFCAASACHARSCDQFHPQSLLGTELFRSSCFISARSQRSSSGRTRIDQASNVASLLITITVLTVRRISPKCSVLTMISRISLTRDMTVECQTFSTVRRIRYNGDLSCKTPAAKQNTEHRMTKVNIGHKLKTVLGTGASDSWSSP